jgi:hypothetical protein
MFEAASSNLPAVMIILLIGSSYSTGDFKMKVNFLIGFAILGLSLASAKSFEISVDSVSKVGDIQLQPGAYKVTLDGANVKFTNEDSGKSVETKAVIEPNNKAKFDATALETVQKDGATIVNEIDLGGTKTDLKFQ